MTPVFDVIAGLPVHALVVHAVVVLLPLMAVVTFVVALRPAWRRGPVARWVALADLIVVGIAYVARLSGKNLQARLSALQGKTIAEQHGKYGTLLWLFALALFVVALLVVLLGSRGGVLAVLTVVLVGVVGAAAIGWTVITGDSGARAVWEQTIANTKPPGG